MQDFQIEIRYLKRTRRATLRVMPGKIIKVTAPIQFREEQVKHFILKNSNWILKRYRMIESTPAVIELKYIEGERFNLRGQELLLHLVEGRDAPYVYKNQLIVAVPRQKQNPTQWIQKKIINFYKEQAGHQLAKTIPIYCANLGVQPKSISLKNYRSRWGCCSTKGDLIFNWQIIAFPDELFNYVAAHEVCHLKEMNHSQKFYDHLKTLGFDKKKYHAMMRKARNLF
ncbi:MAG: M48 family metallopeptidase [Bdellovibrionaceae bacterium]|nr:M48 family metallopeptidase [Bdellovibrio sp.]